MVHPPVGRLEAGQGPSHLGAVVPARGHSRSNTRRHKILHRSPAAQMHGLALTIDPLIGAEPPFAQWGTEREQPKMWTNDEVDVILRCPQALEKHAGHDHSPRIAVD